MATTQTTEADSGSAAARIRHAQSRLSLAQVIEINCKLNLQLLERVRPPSRTRKAPVRSTSVAPTPLGHQRPQLGVCSSSRRRQP